MYINTETLDYPLTLRQVRQAVLNVSLPKKPDEATLSLLGFAEVQFTSRPDGDVVTEGQPELVDGTWRQTWETREFTEKELEDRYKASIPSSISPRQARLALLDQGLLANVTTALEGLPENQKQSAKIEWEYATSIERDSDWVSQLGGALGLTEKQVDELFLLADTL